MNVVRNSLASQGLNNNSCNRLKMVIEGLAMLVNRIILAVATFVLKRSDSGADTSISYWSLIRNKFCEELAILFSSAVTLAPLINQFSLDSR